MASVYQFIARIIERPFRTLPFYLVNGTRSLASGWLEHEARGRDCHCMHTTDGQKISFIFPGLSSVQEPLRAYINLPLVHFMRDFLKRAFEF